MTVVHGYSCTCAKDEYAFHLFGSRLKVEQEQWLKAPSSKEQEGRSSRPKLLAQSVTVERNILSALQVGLWSRPYRAKGVVNIDSGP